MHAQRSRQPRSARAIRAGAVPTSLAVALLVSACGSGADDPILSGGGVEVDAAGAGSDPATQPTTASTTAAAVTGPTSTVLTLPQPDVTSDDGVAAAPAGATDTSAATAPAGSAPPSDSETTTPTAPPATAAPTTPTTQAAPTTQATSAPVANRFPDVVVTDLASGQSVNMATSLGGGDRPVLLWFWSPF